MKFCYNIPVLPFLNNPKDLDPSYKMDLDFWDCLRRKKLPSYNRRNMVDRRRDGNNIKEWTGRVAQLWQLKTGLGGNGLM